MGKILTTEGTAEKIGRPVATLRYYLVQGTAPRSFKMGRRRMFREEDVDAWLEKQMEAAQ